MSKAADERLARRAAAGDERALAAIYRRYHQDLYRYCLSIVGNSEDAQDALQNAMVKVLRALPGEERRIELKPWLYRIAHNESIELLRRRRPSEELKPEQATARGADLADDVAARERLRRLIADLGQLPERQRGALVMRELAGLGYAEIATALGTSPAVARQTLYEARLSLHRIEAGREMNCDAVTRALSDADGRVTRRRDIRAHLRACPECRRFQAEIEGRRGDLAALAPLPAIVAAGLLQGLLGGTAGSGAGSVAGAGAAGAAGGAAAKSLGAAAALKSAAAVAVVAAVGVGAADRAGVVDVAPFGGGDRPQQVGSEGGAAPSSSAPAADSPAVDRGLDPSGPAAIRRASAVAGAPKAVIAPGPRESGAAGPGSAGSGNPTTAPTTTRSHPHGRGHEKQHPSAAAHGQQTAASHKAGGKGSDKGSQGGGNGNSRGGGGSTKSQPSGPSKQPKPPKPPGSSAVKAPKSPKATEAGGAAVGGPKSEQAVVGEPAPEPPPGSSAEEAPDKGRGPAFHP